MGEDVHSPSETGCASVEDTHPLRGEEEGIWGRDYVRRDKERGKNKHQISPLARSQYENGKEEKL